MLKRRLCVASALALGLSAVPSLAQAGPDPQSFALSQASTASLHASVEVPVAVFHALKAGGEFVLTGVEVSVHGAATTVSFLSSGVAYSLELILDPAALSTVAVSAVGTVIVVAGGVLLSVAGVVIAFLPDPDVHAHIHSRRLP